MTKNALSHTRGRLKHFVSKPCQNHSIFEQLGRILKQDRANLRMPGGAYPPLSGRKVPDRAVPRTSDNAELLGKRGEMLTECFRLHEKC